MAAGELVLRAAEGFDGSSTVGISCSDAQNDLTNVDTGDGAVRLAESTTHTGLESIGSGARQHLVDTDDVVRVGAHAEMETFLSCDLDEVLVGADTGCFERFRAQLLIFVGDKVDAEREFVNVRTLTAKVEDPNLRVGYTTVEPRLGIWLVLAVAVASRWTTSHFEGVSGLSWGIIMAQKAAKTLAAHNTAVLNRTLLLTLVIHTFFILLRCLLWRSSFTKKSLALYILLCFPSFFIQFQFERIGRPTYGSSPGELRKSGEDLEAKGLTEYMWDVLYWTYGCVILAAVLGDWAWWWWIVIPAYSAWLAYTTFMGAQGGMSKFAGADKAGTPQAGSKRQQKMEKRGGQKVQYR